MILNFIKVVHVCAIVIWLGSLFVLIQLLRNGQKWANLSDLPTILRKIYLRIDLPALFVAVMTGLILLTFKEINMKAGWFHMKMTAALLLIALDQWVRVNLYRPGPIKRATTGWMTLFFAFSILLALSSSYVVRNKEQEWLQKSKT